MDYRDRGARDGRHDAGDLWRQWTPDMGPQLRGERGVEAAEWLKSAQDSAIVNRIPRGQAWDEYTRAYCDGAAERTQELLSESSEEDQPRTGGN